MEEIKDIELIEKYLKGLLAPGERLVFEQRLQHDAAFAEAYEQYKYVFGLMEAARKQEFINMLKQQDTLAEKPPANFLRRHLLKFAVAASVVLLLLALPLTRTSPFDLYFDPLEGLPDVQRSEAPAEDERWVEAHNAYTRQNYEQAISVLLQLRGSGRATPAHTLYLAKAYLATGQAALAVPLLEQLQAQVGFTPVGRWHLALAYVQQKDHEKARAVLSTLKSDAVYGKRAEQLAAELDKHWLFFW